jgi:hypothetical protein
MLVGAMPIRTALAALPLILLLLVLTPAASFATTQDRADRRPAAAVVAGDRSVADSDGLSPAGLAALVGAGLIPVFVLIGRRRHQQRSPN